MLKKASLLFVFTNLFCVGDSSKYSDLHRFETADRYEVVKFAGDNGDIKVAKLIDKNSDVVIQQAKLFAIEDLLKTFNDAGCCIALVERFEDAGDKIALIYPYKGDVIHQSDLTLEQIVSVVVIMAKIHNLRLGERVVNIPKSISGSAELSLGVILLEDNKFIKKHILDTFLIERTQEACDNDDEKLATVNKAWFNEGGEVSEEIRPEFWTEIVSTGITQDKIMDVLNSFIDKIDAQCFNRQDEYEELQVVSHCNFEAQNIVWDENGCPALVGNSHIGHINPHSEIIGFALTLSGFYHQQDNLDLDKLKLMLEKYEANATSFGKISKEQFFRELEGYMFDSHGTKVRIFSLINLLKENPRFNSSPIQQLKVQSQIALRKLYKAHLYWPIITQKLTNIFKS